MLPDFPKIKGKIKEMLQSEMKKARLSHLGAFADSPVLRMFEGSKSIIVREDGSVSQMNPQKMTVESEIKLTEIERINHEVVLDKINAMAKEQAEKEIKLSCAVMTKTAKETGNVTNPTGRSFSIDSLLKALEKMQIDFDERGQPIGLFFLANPNAPIDKAFLQAEDDPRYQALMERKREEWRVRENNRELVG